MANQREIVLKILLDIDKNDVFSNVAISKALRQNQFIEKDERAFISRLAEGTTEYRLQLDYILDQFSKTPMKKCKPLIRSVLRMGLYQILYMNSVPDSAACNESVKLTKKHGLTSLSGMVNAVLRNIIRQKENIKFPDENNTIEYYSVKYSLPAWLCQKIFDDYPNEAKAIIESSFSNRPTTIRVNRLKTTKEELVALIKEAGIDVEEGDYDSDALKLRNYDFVRKIPGYRQGYFAVQDESSMCAIRDLEIKKDDIILDVCAAPGGKTMTSANFLEGSGHIYSFDISADKLELIEENTARLGIENVTIDCKNATEYDETLNEKANIVIADVPCSGLGIIGRKNDIKYKMSNEQINELISLQQKILENVEKYVKKDGTLMYSTCTINKDENTSNVEWFLEKYPKYKLIKEKQFLQGVDTCDGFYYAILKKND